MTLLDAWTSVLDTFGETLIFHTLSNPVGAVLQLACGSRHTVARLETGCVVWGWNRNGQLGVATTDTAYTPVALAHSFGVVACGSPRARDTVFPTDQEFVSRRSQRQTPSRQHHHHYLQPPHQRVHPVACQHVCVPSRLHREDLSRTRR